MDWKIWGPLLASIQKQLCALLAFTPILTLCVPGEQHAVDSTSFSGRCPGKNILTTRNHNGKMNGREERMREKEGW
ncbi:hypothetical protein BKA57DRAFT_268067 [Linnemannia elongata]|uniref:Uncharacterized protein n=1 Tax=Linnemannia elongata AG-77 TaxID=1314771 RepID=A0A197JZI7_9FUNG|nr:hypothetical protein BKA57DRAFT_268067 [Linnemannia elongata]OAQ30363.1 hypothetical protein K457DRAFT_136978 [Linnemannia elongata AG-77]